MLSGTATSLRRSFEEAVDSLHAPGFRGAMLATRDGFLVHAHCPDVGDLDVFAAMHATALGAAELALQRVGAKMHVTLMAEMGRDQFVSRAISESLFVVAIMDSDVDCRDVLAWMDGLAPRL